ncbi:hypothetical protein Tco_0484776 [Tanacetum coccineum]
MADHSQKWNNGSSRRNVSSSSNSEGITVIVSKLDSLGRDMKKLKEDVHAIQVGIYTNLEGGGILKENCILGIRSGIFGYGSRTDDQPSSGERKSSLTKIINKYMEEAAKRHVEQDKWLRKFYLNTKTNQENHDKIIQGLKTKVKALTSGIKGRTNQKLEECKEIFTEDGFPLYTHFYYSLKEIEYFSANLGFSDDEKHETEKVEVGEAVATLYIAPNVKLVSQEEKQNVSYYVKPYEPPILFPRRLEHHVEEALVHETMESLKKIMINRPLLKEIRQTDNYAKHMKDLVGG